MRQWKAYTKGLCKRLLINKSILASKIRRTWRKGEKVKAVKKGLTYFLLWLGGGIKVLEVLDHMGPHQGEGKVSLMWGILWFLSSTWDLNGSNEIQTFLFPSVFY